MATDLGNQICTQKQMFTSAKDTPAFISDPEEVTIMAQISVY